MPTGYTKTTSTGTDQCIILDPRQAFVRESALPADWQRVRFGAILSICGLGDGNASPVAEQLSRDSYADDFYFGLTDSEGHPGDGDTRFLGLGFINSGYGTFQSLSVKNSGGWKPFGTDGYTSLASHMWNAGTNIRYVLGNGSGTNKAADFPANYDPTASAGYAFWIGVDMELTYGSNPSIEYYAFNSGIPTSLVSAGNTADAFQRLVMATGMTKQPSSRTVSGWWTSKSANPVDCRYLYLRYPFRNNRLRIHAIGAMQLA